MKRIHLLLALFSLCAFVVSPLLAADEAPPIAVSFKVNEELLSESPIERETLPKLLREALLVSWSPLTTKSRGFFPKRQRGSFELGYAMSLSAPEGRPFIGKGKTDTWTIEKLWKGEVPAGKVMVINGIFDEPLRKLAFPKSALYAGFEYSESDDFDSPSYRPKPPADSDIEKGEPYWTTTGWAHPLTQKAHCERCVITLFFTEAR